MIRGEVPLGQHKEYLDLTAIITIIMVTLVWGLNHTAIKYSNQGVSLIFSSVLRSIIASTCGVIYCLRKGERLFHTEIIHLHGVMVGLPMVSLGIFFVTRRRTAG